MALNTSVKDSTATPPLTRKGSQDKKFYGDIEEMMFGFGDEWPPDGNAIRLLESFVVNYIEDLAVRAL